MSTARIIEGKWLIYLADFLNQSYPGLKIAILAQFYYSRSLLVLSQCRIKPSTKTIKAALKQNGFLLRNGQQHATHSPSVQYMDASELKFLSVILFRVTFLIFKDMII